MATKKLTQAELPTVRLAIQTAQGNKCPLCTGSFSDGKLVGKKLVPRLTPAQDHNHATGILRGVLCLACNRGEGQIANRANTAKQRITKEEWLKNLSAYWDLHKTPQSHLVYHTHKTADDKRLLKNKRARLKRAQAKALKALEGIK